MHPKYEFKSISYIFAGLGLATVQPYFRTNSTTGKFVLVVPTIIQLLMLLVQTYFVLAYPDYYCYQGSAIGELTDIVQVFGLLCAGIIQILENIFKSQLDQSIKDSIENIDQEIFIKHFCRHLENCAFCKKRRLTPFLINRIFSFIVTSIAIDAAILLTTLDNSWSRSLYVREFTAIMIRLGLLHIVCHFYWVNTDSSLKMMAKKNILKNKQNLHVNKSHIHCHRSYEIDWNSYKTKSIGPFKLQ